MKNKIILFDIDGTLFDASSFLDGFYSKIKEDFNLTNEEIDEIKRIYHQSKDENGYFTPSYFESEIRKKYPKIPEDKFHEILWNVDLFEKNVYKDSSNIKDLANLGSIGIFSKGDKAFQRQKIFSLKKFLNEESIYIFPNKIDRIHEVFGKYNDFEIYFIDNEMEVLLEAKSLFPNSTAVLIDRSNQYQDNNNLTRIRDLSEIKSIINI